MATPAVTETIPLFKPQMEFISAPDDTLCWIGGLGGGKTEALAYWSAMECHSWDGQNIDPYMVIAAASGPQLKMSTIPKFIGVYEKRGIWYEYQEYKNKLTFGNGAWLKFQTFDIPVGDLKGSELGAFGADESDTCPEEHIDRMFARVRKPGCKLHKRLVGNSPPPKHWIEKWFLPEYNKNMGRLMQSTTYQNPLLPKEYIAYLEKLYPPGTPSHDRMMLGKLGVPMEGAVYSEFGGDIIVRPENVPYDQAVGFVNGLDFGHNHPTVFLVGMLTKDDVLYIVAEYSKSRALLQDHAEGILKLYRGGPIFSDHDAQDRLELQHYGVSTAPAEKDVLIGIQAVRKRMREGKLFIVGDYCPGLISELPYYVWGKNDEPVKLGDDHADAMRYIVAGLDIESFVNSFATSIGKAL